jgi:hypothetical protein
VCERERKKGFLFDLRCMCLCPSGLQQDSPQVFKGFSDEEVMEVFLGLPPLEKQDGAASLGYLLGNLSL